MSLSFVILFTHLLKLINSMGIINFLRQLRILVGCLDALSVSSLLFVFLWEKAHCLPATGYPWVRGLRAAQRPDLQDFPTAGLREFTVTSAGIRPSQNSSMIVLEGP